MMRQPWTLIRRSWSIGLAPGWTEGEQIMLLRIYYYTIFPNINSTRQNIGLCTPAHQQFFPCTPEISLKSTILCTLGWTDEQPDCILCRSRRIYSLHHLQHFFEYLRDPLTKWWSVKNLIGKAYPKVKMESILKYICAKMILKLMFFTQQTKSAVWTDGYSWTIFPRPTIYVTSYSRIFYHIIAKKLAQVFILKSRKDL